MKSLKNSEQDVVNKPGVFVIDNQLPSSELVVKTLPHNTEAEQSLLGAIMMDNDYIEEISDFLLPIHFSVPINGKIYEAIVLLTTKGNVADPITLKAYFEQNDDLKNIGGAEYLIKLVESVVSVSAVLDYAKIIHDLYLRRKLISIGEGISTNATTFDIHKDAIQQIESAEEKLFGLSHNDRSSGFINFSQAISITVQSIETAYKSESSIHGITSGFIDLDKWLGGFNRSDLVIIAGRPSMGKTALATNIAFNSALANFQKTDGGGKVAFFSLEMSSEQLVTRILSQESAIPSEKIRKGEINSTDFSKFVESSNKLRDLQLFIDDTPALTVSSIRTRARRLKRQYGLDMIIIDYLQLLQGSIEKKNENRVQEISEVTRSLKAIAKELNVPVIALSQLSRAVESRDDKRPQLADLRESGSIEQDADVVMFVYREEYYESRKEPPPGSDKYLEWQDRMAKVYNMAEIIVAKQRHGPIGTVRLFFDGKYTKFSNLCDNRKNNYG